MIGCDRHRAVAADAPAAAFVEDAERLTHDTILYRLRMAAPLPLETFTPGRFLQVSVAAGGEVPISLAGISESGAIEVCIRSVGHVTRMAHELGPGSRLGIRGPFGNGFPVDRWHGRNILLIAGGLGIAPIRGLLHYLLQRRSSFGEITLMYGARNPTEMLFRDELARLSCRKDLRVLLTVDFVNGSAPPVFACATGLLTELLVHTSIPTEDTVAAVCGPPALYRCLVGELLDAGVRETDIHLSLERRMKCGTGICCHCAVGDLFCCTDGPVFSLDRVRSIPGAL